MHGLVSRSSSARWLLHTAIVERLCGRCSLLLTQQRRRLSVRRRRPALPTPARLSDRTTSSRDRRASQIAPCPRHGHQSAGRSRADAAPLTGRGRPHRPDDRRTPFATTPVPPLGSALAARRPATRPGSDRPPGPRRDVRRNWGPRRRDAPPDALVGGSECRWIEPRAPAPLHRVSGPAVATRHDRVTAVSPPPPALAPGRPAAGAASARARSPAPRARAAATAAPVGHR